VIPGVAGRIVAVVGRAASILVSGAGPEIDACDVVVRVNWMLPLSGPVEHVGRRTDVLYFCAGCLGQSQAALEQGVRTVRVDKQLRKRIAKESGFDYRFWRPTTGVVAIYDALESGARAVRAFGFDLYRSGYAEAAPPWAGTRTLKWRHSKEQDRVLLQRLVRDPRVSFDRALTEALA
jgi:hypothetical protein